MTSAGNGQSDQPQSFTVAIPAWSLEEDGRILRPEQMYRSWWVFVEADPEARPVERMQHLPGTATLLPEWQGRSLGRHSVPLDVGGAVLYWDAESAVEGSVDVEGWIEANPVDAPPDIPMNDGILRRIRLEWCDALSARPRERCAY